jgi:LmbE family N-acetylglucosaminyl deacetylase
MNTFPPIEARRVLVLAPHPDDETLGCGGSLALYAQQGVPVQVLVLTRGEGVSSEGVEDIAGQRRGEAETAAQRLGLEPYTFLDFSDGAVEENRNELLGRLGRALEEGKADLVYAPCPLDPHPDHRATAGLALELLARQGGFRLAFYETYHPLRCTRLVNVEAVIEQKKNAIRAYGTSLLDAAEVIAEACEGLGRYRQFENRIRGTYEAFWEVERAPTEQEILAWCTWDFAVPQSAGVFRERVREYDRMAHEAFAVLERRRQQVRELQRTAADRDQELEVLRTTLAAVRGSRSWRLLDRLNRLRRRLLGKS